MLRIIDSHCHLNFEGFHKDRDLVLERSLSAGIGIINIGSQYETSLGAVELAKNYKYGIWAVCGLHPIHVGKRVRDKIEAKFQKEVDKEGAEGILKEIESLVKKNREKIVGVGETGLDYFHLPCTRSKRMAQGRLSKGEEEKIKEKQADFFKRQIMLAAEHNLPLIIHCREAYKDLTEILKQEKALRRGSGQALRGVVHCFSGTLEEAQEILNLGLFIGFTGIITFKNALELQKVVKKVPLEKILVETDAPYLAPEPHRGERNLPVYVEFVAKKIAELKKLPKEEVFKKTLENTQKLFNL